jgi:hypothetical protein
MDGAGGDATKQVHLSWVAVALSSTVLSICGVLSLKLNLGLHQQLVVAASR